MAALILLDEGIDWPTTGGMFDWILEQLLDRVANDLEAVTLLHETIDNNLGSILLTDFAPAARAAALEYLSRDLVHAGEQQLPPSEHREVTLARLRTLAELASACLDK